MNLYFALRLAGALLIATLVPYLIDRRAHRSDVTRRQVYIGHVGVALAAKRARRSLGLLVLLVATYTPDWVDTGLCLAGRYTDQQLLSHSIPAVVLFALIGFVLYGAIARDWNGALIVGAVIVSHMILDWITGYKPTWPGGPMIGLRFYDRPMADFAVEAMLIAVGAALYAQTLPHGALDRLERAPRRGIAAWNDTALMLGGLISLQLAVDVGHLVMRNVVKC